LEQAGSYDRRYHAGIAWASKEALRSQAILFWLLFIVLPGGSFPWLLLHERTFDSFASRAEFSIDRTAGECRHLQPFHNSPAKLCSPECDLNCQVMQQVVKPGCPYLIRRRSLLRVAEYSSRC
jgi:hypothetical protein